ncbi:MAG TPA: zinc ABC transporter substrate-binding protein [Stellaceae bacterium]|nr:zinc ABC transporter substrate-binding protein [Stellaceae bacterium]
MRLLFAVAFALGLCGTAARADPVAIVAAENFYGDLAMQIGGPDVTVTSILTNPDQDPHLFEASASTARAIAAARVVILNGADYDPWMEKLLSASKAPGREVIEAAKLLHKKAGDNPHLWYDPAAMPAVAKALAATLAKLDPAHRAGYEQRLAAFLASLEPMQAKIAEMRKQYAGTPVTATEPVFGYMAAALGLTMRNERFQLAVQNDTEPSPSEIAAFQRDLKTHAVKVLLYNSQAQEELTRKMRELAQQSGIPVVGVSETAPPDTKYQDWMLQQLDALDRALGGKSS